MIEARMAAQADLVDYIAPGRVRKGEGPVIAYKFSNGRAEVCLRARIAARDDVMLASCAIVVQPRPGARERIHGWAREAQSHRDCFSA